MSTLTDHERHPLHQKYNAYLINCLLGLTLISVSFRILAVAVLLMLLSSAVMVFKFRASIRTFTFVGFILLFFSLYYLLGLPNFERGPDKFTNLVLLMVSSFSFFFMLGHYEAKRHHRRWINFFCLSSITYVYIVCIYSKMVGYPGYNLVYDIINRSEENSPLYALQLVLFSIVWINNNWHKRNLVALTVISLLTFYFSAVYLGSRAAFILLMFYFGWQYASSPKRLLLVLVLSLIMSFLYLFAVDFSQWYGVLDFGGFSERGIDSPRFSMLVYGVANFLNYPLGGMHVQAVGYTGIWFHNMLLDLVRVAGYYVMLMWVLALAFTGWVFLKYSRRTRYLVIFIILNIALMQDLAFDGFFNIMALEFYIMGHALFLINGRKYKKNESSNG